MNKPNYNSNHDYTTKETVENSTVQYLKPKTVTV